jgi:hypothetical protein
VGYKVSADYRDEVKAVLAFDPMSLSCAMIRLDCCDLLSEIKRSEHIRNTRVVMLFPDGSAERTHSVQRFLDQRFFPTIPSTCAMVILCAPILRFETLQTPSTLFRVTANPTLPS